MLALLVIRIPSPFASRLYNENAANCVSSHLKLCVANADESQKEYCRLPSRNESEHCTASPSTGMWSSPPTTGPRPPPCSGFTFTAINKQQAVFFGGYLPEHKRRSDDVYIIDFSTMVR